MTQPKTLLPERGLSTVAEQPRHVALHRLFGIITRADSVEVLKSTFVQAASTHFSARRAALMLFAEFSFNPMTSDLRDKPVLRYIFEHHAPVHDGVIMAPERWGALHPRNDHGHVLAGPIVREGEIIGVFALTRARDEDAFGAADLADVSALCLHLCSWFARWSDGKLVAAHSLTPRERQIAELVTKGLTNAQIGESLCLSSETIKAALKVIFAKTGINSRAQLAALFTLELKKAG
jgi:DNA-binding CsgD family transcriptional regulator